jgi:hypothetical protein
VKTHWAATVAYVRINRRRSVAGALLAALLLSQGGASAAFAEDTPVTVEFDDPIAKTIEYGEYWDFQLTVSPLFMFLYDEVDEEAVVVNAPGIPATQKPTLELYDCCASGGSGDSEGYLQPNFESDPLPAGNYSFTVSGDWPAAGVNPAYSAETPVAAQLTITKAQLGIDLRVLADSNNPDGAVVSAAFSGRFVDEYIASTFD